MKEESMEEWIMRRWGEKMYLDYKKYYDESQAIKENE